MCTCSCAVYDHEHVLSRWLVHVLARVLEPPNPAIGALEQQYNPERELAQIARRYRLERSQVADLPNLQRRFHAACSEQGSSKFTVDVWLRATDELIVPQVARRIFSMVAASTSSTAGRMHRRRGGVPQWTVGQFVEVRR